MPDQLSSYSFAYVHTDIPEGMTIREWRAQRAAARAAQQAAQREARRRSSRTRMLATTFGRRLRANRRALVWRTEMRHSSGAHGRMSM